MKTLRVVLLSLLLSCFLQTGAHAVQEKQANQAPTGLSLEITYFKGRPPAYQIVPQSSWYALFRRISAWTPPPDSLPVLAVNVSSRMEAEGVRVIVSVHVGRKQFERQDPVASFLLRENEKVAVDELTGFGLEPFEISVIRVVPRSAILPAVTSGAPSVQVMNIQPVASTFPAYKLTLLNSSNKNISALYMETFVDGQLRISAMPHNQDDSILIAAGGIYELKRQLSNVAKPAGSGFLPETPTNQSVFIKTAIFEDGTYEGDPGPAAQYRSFAVGRRVQLRRLIKLYQKALETTDSSPDVILDTLRQQVSELGTEPPPEALSKLLADFPAFTADKKSETKEPAEMLMFDTKKSALKSIDDFKQKQDATLTSAALKLWLTTSKDNYQMLLDRVERL
jgi:hypothetical protein